VASSKRKGLGRVAPRQLQAVPGAEQIRLDRVVGRAVGAGQGRRLGRALNDRVDRLDGQHVRRLAHVAVPEAHARVPQPRQVQLRSAPHQAVDRDDLPVGVAGTQRHRQICADEAGAAGHEHAHAGIKPGPAVRRRFGYRRAACGG
jgi:hypothetical protein